MNHQLESKKHNRVANKPLKTPSIQHEQPNNVFTGSLTLPQTPQNYDPTTWWQKKIMCGWRLSILNVGMQRRDRSYTVYTYMDTFSLHTQTACVGVKVKEYTWPITFMAWTLESSRPLFCLLRRRKTYSRVYQPYLPDTLFTGAIDYWYGASILKGRLGLTSFYLR